MRIYILILFFIYSTASAQSIVFFNSYTCNSGSCVYQASDSGFVAIGSRFVKTDPFGDTIFTKSYNTTFGHYFYSFSQTIDQGYIFAGMIGKPDTMMEGSSDVFVIKTDSLGDTLWTKTWGLIPDTLSISNEGIGDIGYSVLQTIDTGYIVAGMYNYSINYTGIFPPTAFLYKFSSNGDSVWSKTYESNSSAKSVIQTYNGDYVFTGCIVISPFSFVYVVRTNQTGDTLWTKKFNFGFQNVDGEEIIQTDDSCFVIIGTVNYGSSSNLLLCKINSNGQLLWSKIYDRGCDQTDYGFSVDECTDGGLIVTGGAGCSIFNIWLLRTDNNGDTLWTRNYGSIGIDEGNSVKQCFDGGFVITGSVMNGEMFLLKTDSLGNAPSLNSNIPIYLTKENGVSIYPNPVSGILKIEADNNMLFLFNLYDLFGNIIISEFITNSKKIDASQIQSGIYIYKVISTDSKIITGKLVIY